jgi:hypothetical protein
VKPLCNNPKAEANRVLIGTTISCRECFRMVVMQSGYTRGSTSKRPITKIQQHTKTYKTPKILRITESLGSFYGRRRHLYQPGSSWVAGTSTLKRGGNVMICHFTNPFQTFHGGFIPYTNGLFHKPNPHPPGLFHNSCSHNNTGRITLTTPIGLFNNSCFQSLEHIGIKTRGSTKRIGTHCDKDHGAAMRICFCQIDSPFGL